MNAAIFFPYVKFPNLSKTSDVKWPSWIYLLNIGSEDYFCLKHQCVSESQSRQPRKNDKIDIEIFQNALENEIDLDPKLVDYFTVDEAGNPKNEAPPPSDKNAYPDDQFTQVCQD